jgi:diamine N-acetyltransferase
MIGPNLLLRAPEPADIDTIYRWENDTRIWHLGNTLAPYSKFDVEQFVFNSERDIFSAKQLRLMIDWHTSGLGNITVGILDLFDFDPHHKRAGIGVLIDEDYRKRGFATEALSLLIEYCFKTLDLHQVYCNIEQSNEHSIRLFTNAGFTNCGLKKEWLFLQGQWNDVLTFQLINRK